MRFPVLTLCATAATFVLSGCSSLQRSDSFFGFITPYRIEIVQGNAVTKEQLAQVKTGMTRSQVRDVLGSPLVTDPFHANRWDYVFTIRRPGTEPQHRSVVVNFEGEGVKSIEAPNERAVFMKIARTVSWGTGCSGTSTSAWTTIAHSSASRSWSRR
jgi:outer membrane protein assembly factor BamE